MSKKLNQDPSEKFFDSFTVLPNSCWQWRHSLATYGYGKFNIRTTQFMSHRFSYWLFRGDIPSDKQLDHLCRNRGCVNPNHLELVTQKENVLRGIGVAAQNAGRAKCPKGHDYDGHNNRGDRICRVCAYAASRRYLERKKLCLV